MTQSSPTRRYIDIVTALAVLIGSGCQSTAPKSFVLSGDESDSAVRANISDRNPEQTVWVEFHTSNGKAKRQRVAYRQGMFVSELIQETRALKQFRREDIQLLRLADDGASWFQMEVELDPNRRNIEASTDYAVHAGDRLKITQDATSVFDDVLTATLGPLAPSP